MSDNKTEPKTEENPARKIDESESTDFSEDLVKSHVYDTLPPPQRQNRDPQPEPPDDD